MIKTVGFIKQVDEYNFAKDIAEMLIESKENLDRQLLINYMEAGKLCVAWMSAVEDILDPNDENFVGYGAVYTDGQWVWPQYIVEYLKKHPNIHLNVEFTEYVKNNLNKEITLSNAEIKKIEQAYYDMGK